MITTLIKQNAESIDTMSRPSIPIEMLLEPSKDILSMIANSKPLAQIEKTICTVSESIIMNSICSIFILDEAANCFSEVVSTSLPKYYTDVFIGEGIGPLAGSCGSAAYKKARIISTDIASDPLWVVHRNLALSGGLKASWSTPVFHHGAVYAVLNVYKKSTGAPTDFELSVMDYFASLLSIAIDRPKRGEQMAQSEGPNIKDTFKSEYQFQNVIENISGVYWVNDLNQKKTLYVSPSYERIWGRKCESLYQDTSDFIKSIHQDDVMRVTKVYHELKNEESINITYRIVKPDGNIRSVNVKIKLVVDLNGKRLEYGYAEDITDHLAAERKSELLLNRNQQILRNMLDGFLLADINGNVIIANKAYADMVGYELEEVKTMNIGDLEGALSSEEIEQKIAIIIQEGALQFETKHKHKGGALVDLEVSMSVMEIDGQPMITAFMRDITHKKRDEDKLLKQFHLLEKYAFINSHEVRARVATMLGLMNLYLKGYVSGEEKNDVINHLFDETNKLDQVIRELSILITDELR